MARAEQILGAHQPMHMYRAVWELCNELHEPPNWYPWAIIRKGSHGIRKTSYLDLLQKVRALLKALEDIDENPRFLALRHFGLA